MPLRSYGYFSRLLHRLALGNSIVPEMSFDIESALFKSRITGDAGNHVFVSGLARAGTTLLLTAIYEAGDFACLTYRDMPFPLATNLWSIASNLSYRETKPAERAHGDGMLIDFDSPEAFEEVFWRTMAGSDYITKTGLLPMEVSPVIIEKFRIYVRLVLHRYDKSRYLSKNNNSILRLPTLREAFPHSSIVVPFRNPLAHAASLRDLHRKFRFSDGFTTAYMRWLVHHEFGADHRPFLADGSPMRGNPDTIDYWLHVWKVAYRYVISQTDGLSDSIIFFSYDRFCEHPRQMWQSLRSILALNETDIPIAIEERPGRPIDDRIDKELLDECVAIYDEIAARSLKA